MASAAAAAAGLANDTAAIRHAHTSKRGSAAAADSKALARAASRPSTGPVEPSAPAGAELDARRVQAWLIRMANTLETAMAAGASSVSSARGHGHGHHAHGHGHGHRAAGAGAALPRELLVVVAHYLLTFDHKWDRLRSWPRILIDAEGYGAQWDSPLSVESAAGHVLFRAVGRYPLRLCQHTAWRVRIDEMPPRELRSGVANVASFWVGVVRMDAASTTPSSSTVGTGAVGPKTDQKADSTGAVGLAPMTPYGTDRHSYGLHSSGVLVHDRRHDSGFADAHSDAKAHRSGGRRSAAATAAAADEAFELMPVSHLSAGDDGDGDGGDPRAAFVDDCRHVRYGAFTPRRGTIIHVTARLPVGPLPSAKDQGRGGGGDGGGGSRLSFAVELVPARVSDAVNSPGAAGRTGAPAAQHAMGCHFAEGDYYQNRFWDLRAAFAEGFIPDLDECYPAVVAPAGMRVTLLPPLPHLPMTPTPAPAPAPSSSAAATKKKGKARAGKVTGTASASASAGADDRTESDNGNGEDACDADDDDDAFLKAMTGQGNSGSGRRGH
jgi:hypothetical protein